MIAEQGDELGARLNLQDELQHTARVRATIHIIPQRHQRVRRLRGKLLQHQLQRLRAAMDVSDDKRAAPGFFTRGEADP
jgi:hypothetical protein